MSNPDQHSFSGLETRGDMPADPGSLPSAPLSPAAPLPDSTFSGQSTHSGSTSFADLQAAADDLDEVEFEFVELSRHYDVRGELGQGGMGVVYRAFDRQLQRPVAIKRLKPELVANRRALARFQSEALAVASLRHENIVQIYRLGRDAVGPFLVLELVEGESLAARLTRGKLDLDEAIRMFVALAGGISLSHRHGIIHRDIKPGNILLTLEGVPKLSDFGIARRSNDSGLTSTAAAMGTMYYMAPEQHRDARAVTEQSDLYSLAATFYHAVTGEPPQVIREQRLPDAVRDLTLKALESDPAHRHPSVADWTADLRAAQMQLAAPSETTATDATLREGECPACHVTNPPERRFCKGCGQPLTEPCPQCERPSPAWERFCAECGVDIPEKWEAIGQELVEKSQQIEALCREQQYAEALALVQPIESLSSPRWEEWKTWATDTAATLHASVIEQQQERDKFHAEAKAAFQAARYEKVVSLLDQIHSGPSMSEIESLRKEAISRQAELVRLIEDIKAQVASKDYAGLRRNVDRVRELRPDDKRVMKLDQQLRERETRQANKVPTESRACLPQAVHFQPTMQDSKPLEVSYLGKRFDDELRPQKLSEFVGQRKVVDRLKIVLDASLRRTEPLRHILFDGPSGLGKTTLAMMMAREMGTECQFTSGPALKIPRDLLSYLTNASYGSILFIDEIHRLPPAVAEFLYPVMDDFRVDIVLGEGLNARTINMKLKPFTIIGATTRGGMLTAMLRDRFTFREHLDFYDLADLTEIVRRNARKLRIEITEDAASVVADRSRGTPRKANNLLRWARDFASVHEHNGRITRQVADWALEQIEVDALGLEAQDRRYLQTLVNVFSGGPAGLAAIGRTMNIPPDTLEDEVEPFLLRLGFIQRTHRDRTITAAGMKYLGLTPPDTTDDGSKQPRLF